MPIPFPTHFPSLFSPHLAYMISPSCFLGWLFHFHFLPWDLLVSSPCSSPFPSLPSKILIGGNLYDSKSNLPLLLEDGGGSPPSWLAWRMGDRIGFGTWFLTAASLPALLPHTLPQFPCLPACYHTICLCLPALCTLCLPLPCHFFLPSFLPSYYCLVPLPYSCLLCLLPMRLACVVLCMPLAFPLKQVPCLCFLTAAALPCNFPPSHCNLPDLDRIGMDDGGGKAGKVHWYS